MVGGTNKGCKKDVVIGVVSEGMRNENRGVDTKIIIII